MIQSIKMIKIKRKIEIKMKNSINWLDKNIYIWNEQRSDKWKEVVKCNNNKQKIKNSSNKKYHKD